MKDFIKRRLALLIAVCMVITMCPANIRALDSDESPLGDVAVDELEEPMEDPTEAQSVPEEETEASENDAPASGNCGENLTWKLENGVLTISGTGDMSFDGDAPWCAVRSQITDVVLEEGVTSICGFAFSSCKNLTNVVLPTGLVFIECGAFIYCASLTDIALPDGLTWIGAGAFEDCRGLISVTFPDSLQYIYATAFQNCGLTSVTLPEGIQRIDEAALGYAFDDNGESQKIEGFTIRGYTNTAAEIYAEENGFTFESIGIHELKESCGENLTWQLENGALTISGTGDMSFDGDAPWYAVRSRITDVVLEEGVTSICGFAFSSCKNLTNVVLPAGLTYISYCAFDGCAKLASTAFPDSLQSIGEASFRDCGLTSVTLPEGIQSIDEQALGYAYDDNGELKKIEGFTIQGYTNTAAEIYAEENGFTFESIGIHELKGSCGENLTWQLEDGILTISGTGDMSFDGDAPWCAVRSQITDVILEEGVTSIFDFAFSGCKNLTNVVLPTGLTYISHCAFDGCTKLTSITFPDSLQYISVNAFQNCGLTSVTLPEGIQRIDAHALGYAYDDNGELQKIEEFTIGGYTNTAAETYAEENGFTFESIGIHEWKGSCGDNLTWRLEDGILTISGTGSMDYFDGNTPWYGVRSRITDVILEEGVTFISDYAFSDCKNLMNVALPEGLTSIGTFAFGSCTKLTSITFPDSLQYIGPTAFRNCGLTSVTLPVNIQGIDANALGYSGEFQKIEGFTIYGYTNTAAEIYAEEHGFNFESTGVHEWKGSCGDDLTWQLENGVLTISGVGDMRGDVIPPCIVPWHAVRSRITDVVLEEGVTSACDYAFSDCENLTNIVLPDGLTSINNSTFMNCTSLTNVTLPDGLTWIACNTFEGCTKLTSITFPDSLQYIGLYAFRNCGLTSVTLPEGIQNIDAQALGYAYDDNGEPQKIEGFTIRGYTNTAAETYAEENGFTFESIGVHKDKCGDNLTWQLEDGVLTISGTGDMYWNWNAPWEEVKDQITSIVIESGVTSIWQYAFQNCTNLTSVTLPDGLIGITSGAFLGDDKLSEITLPESIRYIGDQAIGYLRDEDTGEYTKVSEFVIHGYSNTVAELYAYNNGFTFDALGAHVAEGKCGDNITWKMEAGVLTISGDGTMEWVNDFLPWFDYGDLIHSVVVEPGITSIAPSAFQSEQNLTSVSLPDTITEIGMSAFMACSSLKEIAIPNGVTRINDWTFQGCGLETITLPKHLERIGYGAFVACKNLQKIELPDTVTFIDYEAFAACEALSEVKLSAGLTYIGYGVFNSCSSLNDVVIPEGVMGLGELTFANCDSLTSITIPASVDPDSGIAMPGIQDSTFENTPLQLIRGYAGTYAEHYATANELEFVPIEELKITAHPKSQSATEGETATFVVEATGDGLSYQWQYSSNGKNWYKSSMTGNKTNTLSVEALLKRNGQQYRCVITDAQGNTVTSDPAALTVRAALRLLSQPENQTALVGSKVEFTVKAAGESLSYQWQYCNAKGSKWYDSGMTGNKTESLTVSATTGRNGQKYRCEITDASGDVVTSDAATLTVRETLKLLDQPESQTVIEGETVKFTVKATGEGLSYQWQYCNASGSKWYNSSMTDSKTANLTVAATMARNGQKYRCVITDADGNSLTSNAATLTVQAELRLVKQPEGQTVNEGKTAAFTVEATGESLTYQWQYSSNGKNWYKSGMTGNKTNTLSVEALLKRNGQQYRCVITDVQGNTVTSNTATLTVKAVMKLLSQPQSQTVTEGETVKLTAMATGEDLEYQWQYCNAKGSNWYNSGMTGSKTATLTVTATTGRNGQKYRCVVTDANGNTVTSEAATLTVKAKLDLIRQPESQTASKGETVKFTVTATGEGLSYQWQYCSAKGSKWYNSGMTGSKTATLTVAATTARNGQKYRCVVSDADGNTLTSDVAMLTVSES